MELTIPLEPLKLSDTLDTIPWQRLETSGSKVSDIRPYAHSILDRYIRSKSSAIRKILFLIHSFLSFYTKPTCGGDSRLLSIITDEIEFFFN